MTRTLLRGGRLLPASGSTSILVDGDRIAWLGSHDELLDRDRTVDLDGRLVTPAFVDAHVHLALTGFHAAGVDLAETRSASEALDRLSAHARRGARQVVLGHSWDETRWAGSASFTRSELDRAVAGRPAYVSRVDLHSAFASTALLDVARTLHGHDVDGLEGWSEQGAVDRDAHHAVRDAMRTLLSADDRAAAIGHALRVAAARGIGMVHELGAPHISSTGDLSLAERVREEAAREGGALPTVVGYWGELGALDTVRDLGCVGAAGDLCVDGAIGSRTAALVAPYTDAPATAGHLYLTADQVADHVVACTEAGLQAGFHVIGDRAVAEVVAGFESAAGRIGVAKLRSAGHRLEHLEMVSFAQARRLGELGLTASVQPLFEGRWGGSDGLYETRLGERRRGMNPFRSLAAAGMTLAFGSDSPVTPLDPWAALRAALHHHDPAQRLDLQTALAAHTSGGWVAARREGGTLAPGAPAYLAAWDADGDLPALLDHPDHRLPACALTLVAGEVAYDEGGLWS